MPRQAVQPREETMTRKPRWIAAGTWIALAVAPATSQAAMATPGGLSLAGMPVDFVLFALVLLGVATLHQHALKVALVGAAAISLYQGLFAGFKAGAGLAGLAAHFGHEWVTLANLLGLLLGFALLADHFEKSRVPDVLPNLLPDDWKGGFVLLAGVFVMSSFLDNIAAAMIGGAMAKVLFRRKVHIGYLAAIVAASNAGGAGSVVGDTTTTMIWIAGGSPLAVLEAYVGGAVALAIFGIAAAKQQHAYQPIQRDDTPGVHVEYGRLAVVVAILVAAILANVWFNLEDPAVLDHFPVIGTAVILALLATAPVRTPQWGLLPGALKGSLFLLALVWCASLMPVERLPAASWPTTIGLGFLSAVFDNIPLTALAIRQDGYDWGFLAYSVGFGGSMIWFGSSAGVALSGMYPEARSLVAWLRSGWHVALGFVAGYLVMVAVVGWHPEPLRHAPVATSGVAGALNKP
jgi:Na+/H+ antiporter NhaD/arsenite permease-like protein